MEICWLYLQPPIIECQQRGLIWAFCELFLEYQAQEFTTVFFIQKLKKCLGSDEMMANKVGGEHNSCERTYQKLKYVFDKIYEY